MESINQTEDGRFECRWCGKSFTARSSVKRHQTTSSSGDCFRKTKALNGESKPLGLKNNEKEPIENDQKSPQPEGASDNDEKTMVPPQPDSAFQIFDYNSTNIRTLHRNGECWFCAKDLCGVLDIVNHSDAISALDEDEKQLIGIADPTERTREMSFINESGLYSLIFRSRKNTAKAFRKWVTSEVIPQIRKTGSYYLPNSDKTKSTDIVPTEIPFSDQHKKIQGMISLQRHQSIPCSPGTSLLYLGYLGLYENLHHFKFGITENWGERIKDLLRDFNGEFSLVFLRPGIGRLVEQELKRFFISKNLLTKYKTTTFTEVFYINEETDIDTVLNEIERLSSVYKATPRVENLEEQLRDERHKNELCEERYKNEVLILQLKSEIMDLKHKLRISELEHKIELSLYK